MSSWRGGGGGRGWDSGWQASGCGWWERGGKAAGRSEAAVPPGPDRVAALTAGPGLGKLQVAFCPDPGRGSFTATYDPRPSRGFASVNAGNGRSLRLGGSGLNGQFERDLAAAGQATEAYQRMHQGLMAAACQHPGLLVQVGPQQLAGNKGVAAAFARVSRADGSGFAAIDIFRPPLTPLHPKNVAMVYCVGPDRRNLGSDAEFLQQVEELGESLALACGGYSQLPDVLSGGLPPLQRVRVGLVSGGKYAGGLPKMAVARALLVGLAYGAQAVPELPAGMEASVPEYELAFDEAVFERAWTALQAELGSGAKG